MNALAFGYAALCLVALGLAWAGRIDADAGGYVDSFRNEQGRGVARDKVEHAVIAFGLTLAALLLGARSIAAVVAVTVLAGVGWELMQAHPRGGARGYFSALDVVADAAGAVLAGGAVWLVGLA